MISIKEECERTSGILLFFPIGLINQSSAETPCVVQFKCLIRERIEVTSLTIYMLLLQ